MSSRLDPKDRSIFPAETETSFILGDDKRSVAIPRFIHDVGENGDMEESLKASQTKLAYLLPLCSIVMRTCDSLTVTYISEYVASMWGYSPEEFTNDPTFWKERIHPDDRPLVFKALPQLFEKNRYDLEYRFLHNNGQYRWVSDKLRLLRDQTGEPLEIVGSWHEIDEQKALEEELVFQRTLLKSHSKAALDGIMVILQGRQGVSFNERFIDMWEIPPGFGEKRSIDVIIGWMSDKLRNPRHLMKKSKFLDPHQAEESRDQVELKDGRTFDIYSAPVRSPEGVYHGIVSYHRDITERKKMIAELNNHAEELEESRQELRNLSVHLQSLIEEERTRIARQIHDEFGQPLTALNFDLAWMKDRLDQNQLELHDKIAAMSLSISSTIERMHQISMELRPGILDEVGLSAAMEWELKNFQNRSGLDCHMTSNLNEMTIDKGRSTALFRVFQESLTNILRHAKATAVKVSIAQKGSDLVMQLEDNGIGITEEQIKDPKSLGLIGMRERMHSWCGKVRIGEGKNGTTVTAIMPIMEDKVKHKC